LEKRPHKVLSITSIFPNRAQPRHGIFLMHRLSHLARLEDVDLRVVAPVPWFPLKYQIFGRYSAFARAPYSGSYDNLAVTYPRFPVLPKVGMAMAPALMAGILLPKLSAMRRTEFDFDVIDSYYLYPDGIASAIIGSLLGCPVLLTALGTDVNLIPNYAVARAQLRWAVDHAAGITAVCQALKDRLVELGVPIDKVEVIRHGVDLELFTPPADRLGLRRRLGFEGPTLISVGHLIQRKGHHLAIAALVHLPEVRLVIAGDGPEESILRRLAVKSGVADRVQFLGHVEQRALPPLVGAADALLLCSDREGIANVLMEALACGTPVLATPTWGTPEVVTCPEAGLLLRDASIEAIVDGVRQLLVNPPNRTETRHYAEGFSWSAAASRHAALVHSIVGERTLRKTLH
jgi:glycosyltransferase involved in cell wall biosynthesis